jgi:hypothetical protein
MIASKEPEPRGLLPSGALVAHTVKDKRRKGTTLFYAGGNEEKRDKQQEFFESIPEFFLTIASGATPIRSAGCAPDENEVIGIMEHALEHIMDYLVKR